VEWSDNIDISDSPPSEYFPRYIEEREISASELEQLSYWHALPEGWETMSYEEFLISRRRAMAEVIRAGYRLLRGRGGIMSLPEEEQVEAELREVLRA
jgi:hypothetical protein